MPKIHKKKKSKGITQIKKNKKTEQITLEGSHFFATALTFNAFGLKPEKRKKKRNPGTRHEKKKTKEDLGRMCFDEANRTRKSVAKFGSGGGRGRRRADEGGGAGDGEEGSGH